MTVWIQQSGQGRKASKQQGRKAIAGIQVVAVLFAVRVGYRVAKAAHKLLFEQKISCVTPVSEDDEQLDQICSEGEPDVTARDQWVLCNEPVPEPPEGSRLMASEHLPISVYHFYEQFLSIETSCLQDHHKSTGQYNYRCSRWKEDGENHFTRVMDFMQPTKGLCSANAHCVQQQRFSVYAGGEFVMVTDMQMQGIPCANCFRVQSYWKAAPDATGLGCNVSIHVAVPFSKFCIPKGLICSTTFKDCQGFYTDFLAKVQNSISTELLPAAAAQAAAAEQLLGSSPCAGAMQLPPPPPPLLAAPRPRQSLVSPFAAVDAEVFVSTPIQAGGSAPQRKNNGPSSWLHWPHKQQHKQQQQPEAVQTSRPASPALTSHAEGGAAAGGGAGHASTAHQQQHQQQPARQPSPLGHRRSSSRCQTPSRPFNRAVSAKPSFALPIAELNLPNRSRPEIITTAQAILLLLVLLVQLITLYDNMAIRKLLAAAGPAEAHM